MLVGDKVKRLENVVELLIHTLRGAQALDNLNLLAILDELNFEQIDYRFKVPLHISKAELEEPELPAKWLIDTSNQPIPKGEGKPIVELVMEDLEARSKLGEKKYGEPLKANNGRNAMIDAYQEAMDLVMYLRQMIEESGPQTIQ